MPDDLVYNCPRCMSKGFVDLDDIVRLNKLGTWSPGPCAFCDETGKVNSYMLNNISPDDENLTFEMSKEDRKNYINNPNSNNYTSYPPPPETYETKDPESSTNILIGLGMIALGGIITFISYSAASGGGTYVVTTGLFVVGLIRFFKGLAG